MSGPPKARSFSLPCRQFVLRVDAAAGQLHLWCRFAKDGEEGQWYWLAQTDSTNIMDLWLRQCLGDHTKLSPQQEAIWRLRHGRLMGALQEIRRVDRFSPDGNWDAPMLW